MVAQKIVIFLAITYLLILTTDGMRLRTKGRGTPPRGRTPPRPSRPHSAAGRPITRPRPLRPQSADGTPWDTTKIKRPLDGKNEGQPANKRPNLGTETHGLSSNTGIPGPSGSGTWRPNWPAQGPSVIPNSPYTGVGSPVLGSSHSSYPSLGSQFPGPSQAHHQTGYTSPLQSSSPYRPQFPPPAPYSSPVPALPPPPPPPHPFIYSPTHPQWPANHPGAPPSPAHPQWPANPPVAPPSPVHSSSSSGSDVVFLYETGAPPSPAHPQWPANPPVAPPSPAHSSSSSDSDVVFLHGGKVRPEWKGA